MEAMDLLQLSQGSRASASGNESRLMKLEKAVQHLDSRCSELEQQVKDQRQELDAWGRWWFKWGKGMTGYMYYRFWLKQEPMGWYAWQHYNSREHPPPAEAGSSEGAAPADGAITPDWGMLDVALDGAPDDCTPHEATFPEHDGLTQIMS